MNPLTPDALMAHEAFVLKLARDLTRDEASALDLRQDVLVTALEAPPKDRSIRGWFLATLRSRKVDQDRRDAGRRHREDAVARPEGLVRNSAEQLEQLELNHSVVQAVLELEDPYRSVVMAVYYEGLTPQEFAQRTGTKAGTVRSQLSRAHDQLKAKLDREHGKRNVWALPFFGLLGREQGSAVTAAKVGVTEGASGLAIPNIGWSLAPTVALGVLALSTAGLWFVIHGSDDTASPARSEVVVQEALAHSEASQPPAMVSLPTTASARASWQSIDAPKRNVSDAAMDSLTKEVPDLLERVRELRWELLQRAMSIKPEVAERCAQLGDNGGVVRLLNRERFGVDWNLPWMVGGGGFYSFSQRSSAPSHQQRQISFMEERLYLEAFQHVAVCLGPMPLHSVPSTPVWTGAALSEADASEFELAWAERRSEFINHVEPKFVVPEVGHSYLFRLAQERDFEILVACEVLELNEEGCTLAWRLLRDWPVESPRDRTGSTIKSEDPATTPRALKELGDEQLREQLELTLNRAQKALFESHPTEIEASYGSLRDGNGTGLARLLPFESPWSELMGGNGHGAEISPLTGVHDEQHAYLGYRVDDGPNGIGELTPSLSTSLGMVCDLGPVPLDSVKLQSLAANPGEPVKLALDRWFGAAPPVPTDSDKAHWNPKRYWQALRKALPLRRKEAGVGRHARAVVGHTYLVRSAHFGERNLLFAVHVAGLDEYGVIVAWRVLDDDASWPDR